MAKLEKEKKDLLAELSQKDRYGENDLYVLSKINTLEKKLTDVNNEWFSAQMALNSEFPKEFIDLIKSGKTLTIDEHEREQIWTLRGREKQGTLGDDVFPFEVTTQN